MILIDMEMPKECSFCKMAYDGGWCILSEEPNENVIGGMMWKKCPYGGRPSWCPLKPFTPSEPQITTNIYDQEEIHHGCTVQVLRNSVTGEVSVGWWKEKGEEE